MDNRQKPLTGAVTTTEIAERFDVVISAVTNWRKRHTDFPDPIDICPECGRPPHPKKFRGEEVERWAKKNGKTPYRVKFE